MFETDKFDFISIPEDREAAYVQCNLRHAFQGEPPPGLYEYPNHCGPFGRGRGGRGYFRLQGLPGD